MYATISLKIISNRGLLKNGKWISRIPIWRSVTSLWGDSLESFNVDEIGEKLEGHTVIKSIDIFDAKTLFPVLIPFQSSRMKQYPSLTHATAPATYPSDPVIYDYLNFLPWIKLPWSFSAKPLYEEVDKLLVQFVPHRNYDVSEGFKNGWKSLAIKAQNGIATNTYAHTHYDEEPNYQITDIAEKCPKTMEMLRSITDIEKCQRIRWMLLEPGTKISVHTDKQRESQEVCLALNIALNMPEGCRFWIDTKKTGEHGRFTRTIPIQSGEAILLNNAKYHYVENNSQEVRIHIIVHGPIRMPDKKLLESAKKETRICDHKHLINQLMAKKALQGDPLDTCGPLRLYLKWLTVGMIPHLLPNDVKILLLKDEIEDEKILHEAVHHISQAGLFPERPYRILNYSQVDEFIPLLYGQDVKFVVCIGAGTYFHSSKNFLYTLLQTISTIEEEKASAAAHIIDHPDHSKGLPFFHEQFFILDLKRWNEINRPEVGRPYSGISTDFPKSYIKGECFHDDYTPKFLAPDSQLHENSLEKYEHGTGGLGTVFMAKSLKNHLKIINIPMNLRKEKLFSYPRSGNCWQRSQVKDHIHKKFLIEKQKVFALNNEKLHDPLFRSIPHFKPKALYSVASGLKPYFLLKEISQRTQQTPDLHFFDYVQNALDYQKGMKNIHKKNKFISYLADHISENKPFAIHDVRKIYLDLKFVAEEFQRCLDEYFQKNFDSLHETIQRTTPSYTHLNIFTDAEVLIDKIEIDKEFMIWTSNIWNSGIALHFMSREELDNNFINFVHTIGKKINKSSWISIDNGLHHGLWGNSKDKPYGMITCGHGAVSYSDLKPILGVTPSIDAENFL